MKEKIIAQRYAEAFLAYAKSTVGIERAVEELRKLKIIFYEDDGFLKFLENLEIIYSEKCEVIDKALQGFSEEGKNFLKLLLEKGRIKSIIGICDYVRINYSHGEAADALLKTSYPLDLELIEKIKKQLENRLKKKLKFHIELEPDLLGGVQVAVGNIIIDGSISRQLDDLKEKLMSVRVN